MSMMMYPEAAPGLPTPPGGGEPMMGGPTAQPMDAMNAGPLPGEGGIEGLLAALAGGGEAMPGGPPPEELMGGEEPMDSIGHIREAMKHLMMAMASDEDEERGLGITKGMGALQGILAGEQKRESQLGALGG